MPLQVALELTLQLGESPLWSRAEKALYWLDCIAPAIHRFYPAKNLHQQCQLSQVVSALALSANHQLLVTTENGYAFVDFATGQFTHFCNPYEQAKVIFNDGRCDHRGRFWSGTASKDWRSPIGKLFRLNADQTATEMDAGFILSNGLGFSPDNTLFYFTDFAKNTLYVYDFALETGTVSHRRPFIIIPEADGHPDGMAVDREGNLWIALWDGGKIHRYHASGELMEVIRVPTPRPTSVAFGGDDLSTLYITTARMGLSAEQLATFPLSGSLFMLETHTQGIAEVCYRSSFTKD